jgi:hypothetical protein
MRLRRTTSFLALAAITGLALASAPAQAASLVGKPCTKLGAKQGDGPGRTIICTKMTKGKNKGKLIWQLQKTPNPGPGPGPGPSPATQIPKTIESWGIDLTPYDAATQMAGALDVGPIPFPADFILKSPIEFFGGGPKRPQDPPDYLDPQMTFIVPLGTVVHATTSGTVCDVRYLNSGYSDDYTIGIGVAVNGKPACTSTPDGRGFGTVATWEHEHVMEPMVKPGDVVKAGQPIGVASYYRTDYWLYREGYALFEIGVLTQTPDGRPVHTCPALYLKASVKDTLLSQLATAARAYETNTGKTYYSAATLATGCVTDKPAYG